MVGKPRGRGKNKAIAPKSHLATIGQRVKRGEQELPEHMANSRTYQAWSKTIDLVEDIWEEYQRVKDEKIQNVAVISEVQDRLLKVLKAALPYEKPRLQTIKLQGDPSAPLFDLTTLSTKELEFLRKTVLKANQVEE